MREAESVMAVETYLNRRMLQWYGDVGRRVREAASVIPVETYLNRRMLQWYGDVGRR